MNNITEHIPEDAAWIVLEYEPELAVLTSNNSGDMWINRARFKVERNSTRAEQDISSPGNS